MGALFKIFLWFLVLVCVGGGGGGVRLAHFLRSCCKEIVQTFKNCGKSNAQYTRGPRLYCTRVRRLNLPRGYFEVGTCSRGGNPMKLQKLWQTTGPIRWPTRNVDRKLYKSQQLFFFLFSFFNKMPEYDWLVPSRLSWRCARCTMGSG